MARRILIVEDDEMSRRLLADVLCYLKYDVDAVDSGEAGLASAEHSPPDAILLDIQLPGIDGFETLRQLRRQSGARRSPVVAVTASAMDQDRRTILEAGFDGYIPKPVNMRELVATLEHLLGKESA